MEMPALKIKPSKDASVLEFIANRFLVKNGPYQFVSLQNAGKSLLAQALFQFPFVQTLFIAQNFIVVKLSKASIKDDAENKLFGFIKEYLDSGRPVMDSAEMEKKIPISVYAESTPSEIHKFVCNRKLVLNPVEFDNKAEAGDSPLALALFDFPHVKKVGFDTNFVAVVKVFSAEWPEMDSELRAFIRSYLLDGKTVLISERVR